MPKLPIDYQNTLHYKIVCNDLSVQDVYNGATTDFIRRKAQHKYYSCNVSNRTTGNYNIKIYQIIRANGGWENWTMVLLEHYPCNSKLESLMRERYWYEELNSTMNSNVPNRNRAEYRAVNKEQQIIYKATNKDKIKEQQIIYKANNKDKIKEYRAIYRANNMDKIKEKMALYYLANKEQQVIYKANNKDKIKEQRAIYLANKNSIK